MSFMNQREEQPNLTSIQLTDSDWNPSEFGQNSGTHTIGVLYMKNIIKVGQTLTPTECDSLVKKKKN